MWQVRVAICSGALVLLLAACASTGNPGPEEIARAQFRHSLAERQVARRRETADLCLRRGFLLPEDYQQKGGGMLEEYVNERPPCGVSAEARATRAEADFRATWQEVMGKPIPLGYEWLLAVKRRLATWVDGGVLTPGQARTTMREAQWILVDQSQSTAKQVEGKTNPSSPSMAEFFAEFDSALNRALGKQGITCKRNGETLPC